MKVIVNADDFGLSEQVSKGILRCMNEGIVTDTNAIVHTPAFLQCAQMAMAQGVTSMGLHCLLTMGKPILPIAQVPTLVNAEGSFYNRQEFMEKQINIQEAEAELEAQITRFLSTGLTLSHINTHHGYMHKSKEMLELFHRLALKYQVPLRNEFTRKGISNPFDDIPMVDMVYFNHDKPHHTVEDILTFLEEANTQYEIVEIGCHPGYSDAYLRSISPLNDDREKELQVFLDKRLQVYLQEQCTMMSYAQWKEGILYEENNISRR